MLAMISKLIRRNFCKLIPVGILAACGFQLDNNDRSEDFNSFPRKYKTPQSVLQAQLEAWERVIANESLLDPFFAKVIESQKARAKRVVKWSLDITVANQTAYNHFFKS